jgi:hypothetical protein
MSPEIIQAFFSTIETIGAVALGGVLAVIITHRLTIDRDRINGIRQRRRHFLAFLESWKHEIGRFYMASDGGGLENHESAFKDVISQFKYESSILKWDFAGKRRDEFIALCDKVVGWKHRSIYGEKLCKDAQNDMDELAAFIEKN